MLDITLKFLASEFNAFLLARTGSSFGTMELGRIVDDAGKWTIPSEHLGLTLLNIEEERAVRSQIPEPSNVNGRQVSLEPELKLNLCVLSAANFTQYDQTLRHLSHLLTFFQSHPTFIPDRYPNLDPQIRRLSVDLQSLSFEQLNQVWAYMGSKYLPSAVYRVRMVVLQDREPFSVGAPITEVGTELHRV